MFWITIFVVLPVREAPMAQVSVAIQNRVKNARYVCSSVSTHVDKLSQLLAKKLKLTEADTKKFLLALHDTLESDAQALDTKEQKYINEQADQPPAQLGRDREFQIAVGAFEHVRFQLLGLQDEQLLKTYGIPTVIPGTPDKLLATLQHAVPRLLKDTTPIVNEALLDQLVTSGVDKDQAKATASVVPAYLGKLLDLRAKSLKAALDKVQREKRETQDALSERDAFLSEWANTYQGVATALEGLYRLVEQNKLADNVRPTSRRRRGEDLSETPIDDVIETPES